MSHGVDETYDVYRERQQRARITQACDACGEPIAPGHTYWRIRIVFDGSARTVRRCERCQAMHLHLRELAVDAEMWPDEQLNCRTSYEDEWEQEPPPEIASLAFVSAEDAQALGAANLTHGRRWT